MSDAWQQVHEWLARERVWIPQPTERHSVPDAHLAALALETWAHFIFDRWRFCALSETALVEPAQGADRDTELGIDGECG